MLRALRPGVTMSMAGLAHRCAYWMRPEIAWSPDAANRWSTGGKRVHHAFACLITRAPSEDLSDEPTLAAMLASADAWLGKRRSYAGLEVEVAYAFDTATGTGRRLYDPPGWDLRWYADPVQRAAYDPEGEHGGPLRASEICGRLDMVCPGTDARGPFMWIRDLKCHFGPAFADAKDQVSWQAIAVARAHGVTRVQGGAVHVWGDGRPAHEEIFGRRREDERGKSYGEPEWDDYTLNRIDCRINDLLRVPANDAQPREGEHCHERYCPVRTACPVTKRIVGELVELAQIIAPERLARGKYSLAEPLRIDASNEEAAWSRVATGLVKVALEARHIEEKAWADANGGIVQKNRDVWSGKDVPKESPNLTAPGAVALMEELGLGDAITHSTSWEAIAKVGGGEAAADQAREELRKIGALRKWTDRVYQARKPKAGARALAAKRWKMGGA